MIKSNLAFVVLSCGLLITLGATEVSARWWSHEIEPDRHGPWGSWGTSEFCPHGQFATAFELKVERHQGRNGDNSALNAVKLYCGAHGNTYIGSSDGPWGDWQGKRTCCNGRYLSGFRMRNERRMTSRYVDNTAANDIQMDCQRRQKLYAGGQTWGEWSSWQHCPDGYAICGLRTKVEPYQGSRDDTALNSVKFYCCKVP